MAKSTSAQLSLAESTSTIVDRAGLGGLRAALVSGVALAVLGGLTSSADAYYRRMQYFGSSVWSAPVYTHRMRVATHRHQERSEQPKKDSGFGEMPKGPLQLSVNISTQKVTLYSNGVRVAQGPVSTGMPGHPTPMGVFSIIEKDRYHHSNIYSGAPMPFMQRITWSGVAIHEGVLPGHPASHGCIRTSHDFAQKLWPITKLGVRFVVARSEIVPVDFAHPKLFVPAQKPPEARIAMNGETDGHAGELVRLAQAEQKAEATDAAPAGAPVTAVKSVEPRPAGERTDDAPTRAGTVAPVPAASETPALVAPAELRKSVEVPNGSESPAQAASPAVPTTGTAAEQGLAKPEPTVDPARPIVPARSKAADQPTKRTGQVAVFVSRKEKKIFVRQGMVPMFDMPIVIEEPDQPLGLHVFTAMGATEDGAGMRWNLMTVPTDGNAMPEYRGRRRGREQPVPVPVAHKPPSSAAEALDRIQFPKEAVERISELLIPGSSLVISDDGLGRETGRGTEFIVLTR